jgi:hypothetical protein
MWIIHPDHLVESGFIDYGTIPASESITAPKMELIDIMGYSNHRTSHSYKSRSRRYSCRQSRLARSHHRSDRALRVSPSGSRYSSINSLMGCSRCIGDDLQSALLLRREKIFRHRSRAKRLCHQVAGADIICFSAIILFHQVGDRGHIC